MLCDVYSSVTCVVKDVVASCETTRHVCITFSLTHVQCTQSVLVGRQTGRVGFNVPPNTL